MELIDMLVSNLGVGEKQAEGGAGLILNMAKRQLDGGDFSRLTTAIPEIGSLVNAAPNEKKSSGAGGLFDIAGQLASAVGGDSQLGQLGKLAGLAGAFDKLGLDADMISKFLPIILSFVQKKGGNEMLNILQGALKQR